MAKAKVYPRYISCRIQLLVCTGTPPVSLEETLTLEKTLIVHDMDPSLEDGTETLNISGRHLKFPHWAKSTDREDKVRFMEEVAHNNLFYLKNPKRYLCSPKPSGMLDFGVGVLAPSVASGVGITSGMTSDPVHSVGGGATEYKQHVFILRHGERRDDVDKEWLVSASRPWDPPLTETGKKQAWAAGRKLRLDGFEINRVLVSPFLRCVQTAAEVVMALCVGQVDLNNDNSTGVVIDPPKVKVSLEFGLCEVMNKTAIRNPRPSADVPWILDIAELLALIPQGTVDITYQSMWPELPEWPETTEASHVRFAKAFEAAADKFPGENVLCVTHGEGVAVSVSHLQPVLVYGVEYCACSHWQRSVTEINGKLSAGKFELLTEKIKSGVLFGDPSEITSSP